MGAKGNVAIFVPHAGCPHRCSFCDQRTIAGVNAPPSPGEVSALLSRAEREAKDKSDMEIAFFGGSFTAVPRAYMLALLEAARPFVGKGGFGGIRVSTRPDAVDREVLSLLREYGVTAVELGAQSMDDEVLRQNGRGHTAGDVRRACGLILEAGLSLGLQMMLGLSGDTPAGAERTAREFAALGADAVRVYPTVVLRGTELAGRYLAGEYRPMSLPEAVELGARLLRFFEGQGVRVLRMGLHASRETEEKRLAGPYHPAYRELCESRIYLDAALSALGGREAGEVILAVHPKAVSKLVGQHKGNLRTLAEQGFSVRVRPDAALGKYRVEIRE